MGEAHGEKAEAANLIPFRLDPFLAGDKEFAKAGKAEPRDTDTPEAQASGVSSFLQRVASFAEYATFLDRG